MAATAVVGVSIASDPSSASPAGRPALTVVNAMGGLDPGTIDWAAGNVTIEPSILPDALASGMSAAVQTVGYVFGNGDPFEETLRDMGRWERLFRQEPRLLKVGSIRDIDRAKREGRLGLIPAFQTCEMLSAAADRVDLFADFGIRSFQLTYNGQNLVGSGCLAPHDAGLTDFGREIIDRVNARRAIVDLSHGGRKTALEAARFSTAPVAVTHTGCAAIQDHPRNASDELLRLVADRGGFVGLYFMPYLTDDRNARLDDLVAHIEHAVHLCGEDHVGIGTDGGTTFIDVAAAQAAREKKVAERRAAGVAAPGERGDIVGFIPELNGPGQFGLLADRLVRRGHGWSRIEKILGANFTRYAGSIWDG